MLSGKANIQSANPPSQPEPDAPPIIPELGKPQEQAKHKPRKQQHKRGLQEHGLGLRQLPDGVEGEDALRYAKVVTVGVDAAVGGDGGVGREEDAAVVGPVQQMPNCTSALASIVADAVCWAAHSSSSSSLWVLLEKQKDEIFALNFGFWMKFAAEKIEGK
jgi:hypothetical protein